VIFAPQLDAGGYLSVFFREAIEGDATLMTTASS